jgi:hypothetical protein
VSPQERERDLTRVELACGHQQDVHAVGHTPAGVAVATCITCGFAAAVVTTTNPAQEG